MASGFYTIFIGVPIDKDLREEVRFVVALIRGS